MKNMKYIVAAFVAVSIFAGNGGVALAQTSSSTEALLTQVQTLLKQVKSLQDQMAALDAQKGQLNTQLQQTLQLTRSLSLGMTSSEVKLLQEILAIDPDIYPEGLTTGFYGPLTQKAVKKFQAKFDIDQAGTVGPKTLAKLNQLLTEGAGNSGKVPPGLLIAPGIAKKLGYNPTVPANQDLPPGIAKKLANNDHDDKDKEENSDDDNTPVADTTAPVISNIAAVSAASTTAYIYWTTNEKATSTLWYGTTTPIEMSTALKLTNNSLKTVHSMSLGGLTATTTYYYKIEVSDVAGNRATTTERSFVTPQN